LNDTAFGFVGKTIDQSIGAVTSSLKESYAGLANNTRAIAQASQSEASQQTGTLIGAVKWIAIAGALAYALKRA